ncbi:aminotransferase class V-fold PLP-dependent enzyme [Bradymonas sediminis]|uniref:cysteine desulfurase n=1 Tax=Bradymonas sediminis TaxID=1548548 RepID=A0A2Z4FGT5_9DELT|nr:cysteine desulfurase CsdA [Bradymonas sediminis]TDP77233.1 cysteine desulfurase/selenocysteine lyase [Bradymonas sediminis]
MTESKSKPAVDRSKMSWEEIRAQFPVLHQNVGAHPLAYLDNAASSQMPQSAIDRLMAYQTGEHSNVHRGVHMLSQRATDAFDAAREKVRRFINAGESDECIFTRGATESINLVAYAWGRKFVGEGDEIIVSAMEHHANIVPWQILCQEKGARLRVLPMTDQGVLIVDALDKLLNERTKLLAVTHVSNALGTINPIAEIIEKAHKNNTLVMVDGCQATPHMKVDVQALDADFYAFSGHKMCGPTGVGVLYGKRALLERMNPFLAGGDMIRSVSFEKSTYAPIPHKFEAGTPAILAVVGLGAAIDYLESIGIERIAAREHELLEYATAKFAELDGVRILGTAAHKAAVISFEVEGVHPHDIGTILDTEGVAIRAGHHCAQPVMTRLGVPATARASFSFYNNRQDIDALISALATVKEIFH